jgi:hypothetical protein
MDEMDRIAESRGEKVLRAADVMPPFHARDDAGGDSDSKTSARSRGKKAGSKRKNRRAGDAGAAGRKNATERIQPDDSKIPTFDLAESILARQRRITAGRRKKRSPAPVKRDDGQTTAVPMYIDELSAQEQAELQQIVAEIVARDIQRLCRGSSRFLPV